MEIGVHKLDNAAGVACLQSPYLPPVQLLIQSGGQYEEETAEQIRCQMLKSRQFVPLSTFVCQYLNILLIPVCVPASSICRGRTGGGRRGETGKLYRPTPTCIFVHFSKCISFHCKMYFAGDRHCTPTCNFPYISAFFATAKFY